MLFRESIWIGMPRELRQNAAVMFRREFLVDSSVKRADLHICGLGYYEAWINGKRVGDRQLDPAQSDYEKRCFYVTHDVTSLLIGGDDNALGIIVGDGWYNQDRVWKEGTPYGQPQGTAYGQPRVIASLEVTCADGSSKIVDTGSDWKCATGAIVSSNIYAGETYDARLEQTGWDCAGFDDSHWNHVMEMGSPGGQMLLQECPPIKEIQTIVPVNITADENGEHIVDMGQNFSGWARIRVRASRGTEIRMTFAEAVDAQGRLDTASTGVFATDVEQKDTYICKGQGVEVWQPRFTYHGFRYVQVKGWVGEFTPNDITGIVVHTALKSVGEFKCSDARLNQLHEMALWTHRSNIHSIPEDCPARERCGWLGDAHLICDYSMYNYDGLSFWEKYLGDIETTRELNGGLPCNISPGKRTCGTAKPDWMVALILLPWKLYVFTGKDEVLRRHYDGMKCVMDHFVSKSSNGILRGGHGDWCDPKHRCSPTYTPEEITTTIWFYEASRIMSNASFLLGNDKLGEEYRNQAEYIRDAFIRSFFDKEEASYGSQTANALALNFGLVEEGVTHLVVNALVQDIVQTHDMHHTVGIMGMRYLFEVLSRFGHGGLAVRLMNQDTCPGFGDIINRGATTLWEYWGENEVDQTDGPRSLNHPMMGGFDNWFYNTLGGIKPDISKPGFRHIILEPIPPSGIEWVNVSYDSPAGMIVSQWKRENGRFKWKVVIPEDATASAILPDSREVHTIAAGEHFFTCEL